MAYEAGCDRVHSVTDPVTGTISYTYLPTGERISMTLPGGGTWTYHYAAMPGGLGQMVSPGCSFRRIRNCHDIAGGRGRPQCQSGKWYYRTRLCGNEKT